MLKKKLLLLGGLAAATTIPIAASKDGVPALKKKIQSVFQTSEKAESPWDSSDAAAASVMPQAANAIAPPSLSGPKTGDLRTVFDFRITPSWVTTHWTRVSTELAETKLQGMRVPVVTGTGIGDVHGSLTYYFNDQQVLERISFFGFTGDPSALIAMLREYHQFEPARSLSGIFYSKRWNNRPVGALWIEHAPVVDNNARHARYRVRLEINSTLGAYKMSDQMAGFVKKQELAGRWSYH